MSKHWIYKKSPAADVASLANQLKLNPLIIKILQQRNITQPEQIKDFISPALEKIAQLPPLQKSKEAAQFIIEAIKQHKKIFIYGDFDVDGVVSTVLLMKGLKKIGARVDYFIPLRTDGYSLNKESINFLHKKHCDLLITVDNGISALQEITLAKKLGMQVVITDHHQCPKKIPPADFIINPHLYSQDKKREIAGVGVAILLLREIYKTHGSFDLTEFKTYLDLVALGTIADVVPLHNKENRLFAIFGLPQIAHSRHPGLIALNKIAQIKNKITPYTVSFVLGPRINAAGRLADARLAADLLLEEDEKKAAQLAYKLNNINYKRKSSGAAMFKEAHAQLEKNYPLPESKVFVLHAPHWNPGLIGIAASQIAKTYNRPAALIGEFDNVARGSIRSIAGLDIMPALTACSEYFLNFGGHKEAAGFTLARENIEPFKKTFIELLSKKITDDLLIKKQEIDLLLNLDDISIDLVYDIQKLQPFGKDHPAPTFACHNVQAIDYQLVGDGSHLKATFSNGKKLVNAIGFGLANLKPLLDKRQAVDLAFSLELNNWNNQENVQLHLHDIKLSA